MKNRVIYFCANAQHFKEFDKIRELVYSKDWNRLKDFLSSYKTRVLKLEGWQFTNPKEFNKFVNNYYYKFKITTTKDLD